MQTKFLENKIDYDGSQLRSHWIFDTIGVVGDVVASFIGGCDVIPEYMVDLADKNAGRKIYSEEMLHFIAEHFDIDMARAVLRQRLLVAAAVEVLARHGVKGVVREGNDLYDGDAKLSVSIATVSPVSSLVHFGINISSRNTPVKTKGLGDYNTDPRKFAEDLLKKYKAEMEGAAAAQWKVRWVK